MPTPLVDLSDFDVWLVEWREKHRAGGAGSGRFSRVPHGSLDGRACADFAIIDYGTGPWPLPPSEVDLRVNVLQQYQSEKTGLFDPEARPATVPMSTVSPEDLKRLREDGEGMDKVQGTAYFLAALEMLGARPLRPLRALEKMRTPTGIAEMMDSLDWTKPDRESVRAAGVATCLAIAGDVGPEWFERYLGWLEREVDVRTGFWRNGVESEPRPALRAAYHQYMVFDRFNASLPKPDKALKTALNLQGDDGLFGDHGPGWGEAAAVFVIDRAFRQCGKTFGRLRTALTKLAGAANKAVHDEAFRENLSPYRMAGFVSFLALLSQSLPGSVKYTRPLRFYGDRRLFV